MIDETDRSILAALQRDGRIAFADLAKQVGLAPSTVHARVQRLEQTGVIRGYRAVVDAGAAGRPLCAIVGASHGPDTTCEAFEAAASEFPEIEECYCVTGEPDHLLKVHARDPADLHDVLADLQRKTGARPRSWVVLHTAFEGRAVPTGKKG
jgi:Lrp/AsnC family leucine-responsive transcriptional regulator